MSVMKNVQKFCSANRLICLLGVVILAVAVGSYSMNKGSVMDGMSNARKQQAGQAIDAAQANNNVHASQPLGENSDFQAVSGISGGQAAPGCTRQSIEDPAALLPKDSNSAWARLNPNGQGSLNDVNLLKAGHHIGIDTIGQPLRNANLQLRSEPANPQINIGPWNNSTMEPDAMRIPLEIGQGPQ